MKRPPKEFVFRYNGNPHTEQVTQDFTGKNRMHYAGDIICQNGKEWKVAVVQNEYPFAGGGEKVVQRVFLTDKF